MNSLGRTNYLTSLSITHSKIHLMPFGFGESHPALACLDISNNVLTENGNPNMYMLLNLIGLKKLVLANNTNMIVLPYLPPAGISRFIELDVSGNCFKFSFEKASLYYIVLIGRLL